MTAPASSARMFTTGEVEWPMLAAYRANRLGGRRSALVAALLTETEAYGHVLRTIRNGPPLERALWGARHHYAGELVKRVHARRRSSLYWSRPSR